MNDKKGIIELNEINLLDFPTEEEKIANSKKSTKDDFNPESPGKKGISSPSNNANQKENDSLSDINFIDKPENLNKKNNRCDDTSVNIHVRNIIPNEDIYLETSSHNPFTMSTNSNNLNLISGNNINYNNNNFKKFMKAKKLEIEKKLFISDQGFEMNTKNKNVFLKILDVQYLEEERKDNIDNLYNKEKAIPVFIKVNNSSITAFNVNTNFSVVSGEYFPIMHLNFNSVSAVLFINEAKLTSKICVLGSEKAFLLEFNCKSFFENFNQVLNEIIKNSLGNKTSLHSVTLRKDYYKHYTIKVNELLAKIKTGDILLFRCNHMGAKCQRCFTGAHYDHAALLVKRYEYIEMYEATSTYGCKVRPLSESFFSLNDFLFGKIIYRELKILEKDPIKILEINKSIRSKLEDFLTKTKGSGYRLPCSIICCPGKKTFERFNDWGKSKGFFCSQLVAAAYMNMGIIKYEKSSASYLPGNLSQNESIPFNPQFDLGPEYIIDVAK